MARTSLAWNNLVHQPARTFVSLGGIGFAILLMFMQLGFLGAVGNTATNVFHRLDADLVVRSPEYLHAYAPGQIDQTVIERLLAMPAVADVRPLDLGVSSWRNPTTGQRRAVAVMGIDPEQNPLQLPELDAQLPLLRRADHVLVDRTTRLDYGPYDGERFGIADVGRSAEVMGQRVRVAGTFAMGTGLAANGAIIVSRAGFPRITPRTDARAVSLALVRLHDGLARDRAAAAARDWLASDQTSLGAVDVLTMPQAIAAEKRRWYLETPIGIIFGMGVVLAVVVGGVICYMVLAADVISHLPEYATLKAIGYGNGKLARTLLAQACYLASLALPPATLAALALYRLTSQLAGLPIQMAWQWLVLVTVLSYLMCSAAGLIALRKLVHAEPASLF